MFDGSDIATMSVAPARLTGMTMCLRATSCGMSLSTSSSISKSFRLIDGQAVLLGKERGQVLVLDEAELRQGVAEALSGATGFVLSFLQLLQGDELFADEQLSEAAHGWCLLMRVKNAPSGHFTRTDGSCDIRSS
jgi:hypothetical protein